MLQSLLWLCVSTLLTIAGFAGALPTAATVMERQGLGAGAIGVITSLIYAGILGITPFQPFLARRFGAVPTYQMGKMLSACGFAGLAFAHAPWMWSLGTLFIGFGAGLTWPVTDSLLAAFAPPDKKGAWMGMFQTGMGAAYALGPFIAAALAQHPKAMFIGAAVTGLVTSLPLIGRQAEVKRDASDRREGLWEVLRLAPGLPILGFIGGFFENGTHTAVTLSALALHWNGEGAISLAGVIGAGAFFAQYPVGRLADARGARSIIAVTLWIMIAGCLPLPLCGVAPWLFWVIAFVWGAAGGCLYTLAITGMAQRFSGTRVMTATTLMVMSYTIGGITGPAVAGYAVQGSALWGPALLFAVASLLGLWRQPRERGSAGGDTAEAP
jgi:MFS family permease